MSKWLFCPCVLAVVLVLAGCQQEENSQATVEPAGVTTVVEPAAKTQETENRVFLRRAYVGGALDANGLLNESSSVFKPGQAIYLGALLSGNSGAGAASATVDVRVVAGNGSVVLERAPALVQGDRAVISISGDSGGLASSDYVATVYLNGTPSWEVRFAVQ